VAPATPAVAVQIGPQQVQRGTNHQQQVAVSMSTAAALALEHPLRRSWSLASNLDNPSIHAFSHDQLHGLCHATTMDNRATRQQDHLPQASIHGAVLKHGEVVAVADRTAGGNGTFQAGDIGEASWQKDGNVHINWCNGSATKTAWPNPTWYRGQPRTAVHTFI